MFFFRIFLTFFFNSRLALRHHGNVRSPVLSRRSLHRPERFSHDGRTSDAVLPEISITKITIVAEQGIHRNQQRLNLIDEPIIFNFV